MFRLADWITEGDSEDEVSTFYACDWCDCIADSFDAIEHFENCPIGELQRVNKQTEELREAVNRSLSTLYATVVGRSWENGDNFELLQWAWDEIAREFKVAKFDWTKGQKPKAGFD